MKMSRCVRCILLVLMTAVLFLSLSACAEQTNDETEMVTDFIGPSEETIAFSEETTETQEETAATESTAVDSSISFPQKAQIQNDIYSRDIQQFYLNGQTEYLTISSLEVLRAKVEDGSGEAHVAARFENNYYCVDTELALYYSYYDVGGWYLDDYVFTSCQSSAKAVPVTDNNFISFMCQYFDSCDVLDRYSWTDISGNYCEEISFSSVLHYGYLDLMFTGTYDYTFCDDYWQESCSFDLQNIDWSSFIGAWQYRDMSYFYGTTSCSLDIRLDILDIVQLSNRELQVTYSGSTYLYDKSLKRIMLDESIETRTRTIDITETTITILGCNISVPRFAEWMFLPWTQYDLNIILYYDTTPCILDSNFSDYAKYFSVAVSNDEVQDAIDRLNGLNGDP